MPRKSNFYNPRLKPRVIKYSAESALAEKYINMNCKASNKYYIFILVISFPFFGFCQIVDYSSNLIKINKIKSIETYEIYGFGGKKMDTIKALKIDFDTLSIEDSQFINSKYSV